MSYQKFSNMKGLQNGHNSASSLSQRQNTTKQSSKLVCILSYGTSCYDSAGSTQIFTLKQGVHHRQHPLRELCSVEKTEKIQNKMQVSSIHEKPEDEDPYRHWNFYLTDCPFIYIRVLLFFLKHKITVSIRNKPPLPCYHHLPTSWENNGLSLAEGKRWRTSSFTQQQQFCQNVLYLFKHRLPCFSLNS